VLNSKSSDSVLSSLFSGLSSCIALLI
jgi:hypothetical protein